MKKLVLLVGIMMVMSAVVPSIRGNNALTSNDVGKMVNDNVTFSNSTLSVPDAVDLGLSVKWASFNLGATKPEEYGDYYAWGETEPYYLSLDPVVWKDGKSSGYDKYSYIWCTPEIPVTFTKYPESGKCVLDLEDDAAYMTLKGNWRMPTNEEFIELITQCDWIQTSMNGIKGRRVIGPNGNSIFFPATGMYFGRRNDFRGKRGDYWSSSGGGIVANSMSFFTGNGSKTGTSPWHGLAIRPVYDDK